MPTRPTVAVRVSASALYENQSVLDYTTPRPVVSAVSVGMRRYYTTCNLVFLPAVVRSRFVLLGRHASVYSTTQSVAPFRRSLLNESTASSCPHSLALGLHWPSSFARQQSTDRFELSTSKSLSRRPAPDGRLSRKANQI